MALRFGKGSGRIVAVIIVVIVVVAGAAGVVFARDRILLTRVLAHVDSQPAASDKACANPCRGGRMLLL